MLTNLFPKKERSLDSFISTLKQEESPHVVAYLMVNEPLIGTRTSSVGFLGYSQYFIFIESETQDGRIIRMREKIGEQYEGEYGFSDKKSDMTVKSLVTAQDRLAQIKQEIPGIEAHLLKQDGLFEAEDYLGLGDYALDKNITALPLNCFR